jgi:uncharacterized protein (UPF0261 family)
MHAHNRLLTSVVLDSARRRETARAHCHKLAQATGPTALLLPLSGCGEWDREGRELHDAEGLAAFLDEMQLACPKTATLHCVEAHINDAAFSAAALAVFDAWLADGTIQTP